MKIVIFGSCVSRDAVEFDTEKKLKLVKSYSRSALYSAYSEKKVEDDFSSKLSSKFQRTQVSNDFRKVFRAELPTLDFDYIIYDPIDERFSLFEYEDGRCVTISKELAGTGFTGSTQKGRLVRARSTEYFQKWEIGWVSFVNQLKSIGALDKLLVNQVYWTKRYDDGDNDKSRDSEEKIDKINKFFSKIYARIAFDIKPENFIKYSKDLVVGKADHRWGRAPIHYIDDFYKETVANIVSRGEAKQKAVCKPYSILKKLVGIKRGSFKESLACDSLDSVRQWNNNLKEFYWRDEAWKQHFSEKVAARIKTLCQKCLRVDQARIWFPMAIDEGQISIDGVYNEGFATCERNYFLMNRNFLEFFAGDKAFYLIQHHMTVFALYFPHEGVVIKYHKGDLPISSVVKLKSEVLRCLRIRKKRNAQIGANRFFGIIGSYPRPYHFFYDLLPIIYRNVKALQNNNGNNFNVLQIKGGNFVSVKDFMGIKGKELLFKDEAEVNAYLAKKGQFSIKLGYNGKREPGKNFTDLDSRYHEYGLSVIEKNKADIEVYKNVKSCSYVLWLGICSEKRAWIEQIESLSAIINYLCKKEKSVAIIVDGITRTQTESERYAREHYAKSEIILFERLKKKVGDKALFVNLIGSSAEKKIVYANASNSFICSYLTDSMYVARMANKPGIGHGAVVAITTDHQHPKTRMVPKEFITDSPDKSGNWSKASYSIQTGIIEGMFEEMYQHYSNLSAVKLPVEVGKKGKLVTKYIESKDAIIFRGEMSAMTHSTAKLNYSLKEKCEIPKHANSIFRINGTTRDKMLCKLVISIYSGKKLMRTEYAEINDDTHIKFGKNEDSYELGLRISGVGEVIVQDVQVMSFPEVNKAKSKSNNEIVRDYEKWEREVFHYENLDSFLSEKLTSDGIYSIKYGNGFIDMNFYNKNSEVLVVFFNASLTRNPSRIPPFFSGMSGLNTLNSSILMVSDPALYLHEDISTGWYAGAENMPLQHDLPALIKHVFELSAAKKLIFYGGSSGGFASLFYAPFFGKIATAIVCNPQIHILKYFPRLVKRYLASAFSYKGDPEEFENFKVDDKPVLSLSLDKITSSGVKIIYLQNKFDTKHYNDHLKPFLAESGFELKDDLVTNYGPNFICMIGQAWGVGHQAAPKPLIYDILKLVVDNHEKLADLNDDLVTLYEKNKLAMAAVNLNEKDGVLHAETELNTEVKKAVFSWYLIKDGKKIDTVMYSKTNSCQFSTKPEAGGLYTAIGFLKADGLKESIKSQSFYYNPGDIKVQNT